MIAHNGPSGEAATRTVTGSGRSWPTHDRRLWKRATGVGVAVLNFPALARLVGLAKVEPL